MVGRRKYLFRRFVRLVEAKRIFPPAKYRILCTCRSLVQMIGGDSGPS